MPNTIEGSLHVAGRVTAESMTVPADSVVNASVSSDAAIARSKLAQDVLKPYTIPLTDMRTHDAFQTVLPGTSSSNDLALVGGTFGTNAPNLQTADLKNAGATSNYARFVCTLPAEYDAGQTIVLRVTAGMLTTVASASSTIDVECYRSDEDNTVSADLCATSAASCNSLTFANLDFTITATDRVAGDILDIRLTSAVNDSATGTAVIACISAVKLMVDVKG